MFKITLLLSSLFCLTELPSNLWAQEAVSTTTSGGSAAASSQTTGTSSTSTNAPATGVTSSAAAGPAVETGPSGGGVFSRTPVEFQATISGGYDDNVGNTQGGQKQGSGFTSGNILLDYTFGDPRLQLILNAGAGGTYYYQHLSGQDYDIDLSGAFAITYRSSPRLTLGSTLLAEYLTEPSFQYAGGLNFRNGNYLYTSDKFFVSYVWVRRFSTKTSYTFEAFNFDNNAVGVFSNRVSNTFGNEFRFQLAPTTLLVAEYRYDIVSYENASLDSTTHFALGGIDHVFNPRLSGSFRGGAEFRSYDSDGKRTGPYFEGSLTYALGRRTSVTWNGRYGLEEPDIPATQSRTTFRTGVQTKFDLTSRIASTIDLYYVHDDYHPFTAGLIVGPAFSENSFDGGISVRYKITPLFGLAAGYHYTDVSSDMASRAYSRNRAYAGANVTF